MFVSAPYQMTFQWGPV